MEEILFSVVDELSEALDIEAPCGIDLAYDPAFMAFEQEVKGKPEVQYGETIMAEVMPDWKSLLPQALHLLERSRDLRLAVPFSRALLHMQGIAGFAIGLALIEQLLARHWECVHPELDPTDDNDPMARINTLASLADATVLVRELKETALIQSRVHGRFSLRDIDIATGEQIVDDNTPKPNLALLEAAFDELEKEDILSLQAALQSCCNSVLSIESILTEKVGFAQALNLSALLKTLERARKYVNERLNARGIGVDESAEAIADDELIGQENSAKPGGRIDILNRQDVISSIDRICHYYEKYEPSSPVPLILQRAKQMVNKSFLQIMEELAPDAMHQITNVTGSQAAV